MKLQFVIGIAAFLVFSIGGIFVFTGFIDKNKAHQISNVLDGLRSENNQTDENLLKFSHRLFFDYDPLVQNSNTLDHFAQRISSTELGLYGQNNENIDSLIRVTTAKIKEKRKHIEEFKSNFSILKNSITSLPILKKELEANNSELQIHEEVNDIVLNALIYITSPSDFKREQLKTTLSNFQNKYEKVESDYDEKVLQLIIYHSSIVLDQKIRQQRIISAISDQNLSSTIKELQGEYLMVFEKKNEQYERIISLFYLVSILLFIIVIGALVLIKKKANQIQHKSQRITESINYAKKIQKAVLPKRQEIETLFPDNFIMYQPKDIVSGDFYWFHQTAEHTVVACVDCSGHGVPGAFMSVIGKSLLEKIVVDHQILIPDRILYCLDIELKRVLKQEESSNKEGMDLSICVLNKNTLELQYAGAYNPLIYIQNNKLHEFKADRFSIGYFDRRKEKKKVFHTHSLTITEDTCFYMFSDGFKDQFGGEESQKFTRRRLQELLYNHHQLSMKEQSQIFKQKFMEWKGIEKQTDDVMLIGFRISMN
ncbi:DAHL domain-containing protein [Sediminitomix flava]|uniref:Serine phosphatase RsbU (Regulator of sigma subunit) n=1 Tax=Sediminitomix flava TaxID=379075 RepID=A0A315Z6U2_SEDFL|nr:DAHL domain-containing protein [Sediminitomix flava]PWJ39251.1 serine phosphatase RsbU (regulator of sigma subunit) [Sediminitomix flava]